MVAPWSGRVLSLTCQVILDLARTRKLRTEPSGEAKLKRGPGPSRRFLTSGRSGPSFRAQVRQIEPFAQTAIPGFMADRTMAHPRRAARLSRKGRHHVGDSLTVRVTCRVVVPQMSASAALK
jgi:hypothetical protein